MSSIVNVNAANLLKFSALGFGVWYGAARNYSLHSYVQSREEVTKDKRYRELVEEAKIAFDAHQMEELAVQAKKAHIDSIDPNSYKYNAEVAVNWLIAKMDK